MDVNIDSFIGVLTHELYRDVSSAYAEAFHFFFQKCRGASRDAIKNC